MRDSTTDLFDQFGCRWATCSTPLTPEQIQTLVSAEVQHQMTDAQRFSFLDLLGKTAQGCVVTGVRRAPARICRIKRASRFGEMRVKR